MICVVHEQWPIHIGQHALVDVIRDDPVEAVVEFLVRAVDLGVAGGKGVGEVEFKDYVVLVGGEVDQVLFLLAFSFMFS